MKKNNSCRAEKIKFLGIPVGKKVYLPLSVKTYLFGVRVSKKRRIAEAPTKKVTPSTPSTKKVTSNKKTKTPILNDANLNIAVSCDGEIFEILICLNWLTYLLEYLPKANTHISLYISKNQEKSCVEKLLYGNRIVDAIICGDPNVDDYDCTFKIKKYPIILKAKEKRIYKFSEWLIDYIYEVRKFNLKHHRFTDNSRYDTLFEIYSGVQKKNIIQQLDVTNSLNIGPEFKFNLHCILNEEEYLKKLKLDHFITIHTQQTLPEGRNYTKLWPNSYYQLLVCKIKEKFPSIRIIQIGSDYEDDLGADINLSGKIDFEEEKVLLKNSTLHIDFDSHYVTIRKLLTANPSVVLFGPTSPDLYGYASNINIRSSACAHPCEQVIQGWKKNCVNRNANRACMLSILPETVFKIISENLNGGHDE